METGLMRDAAPPNSREAIGGQQQNIQNVITELDAVKGGDGNRYPQMPGARQDLRSASAEDRWVILSLANVHAEISSNH
jgi:hypothetical protein